jgi:hypothetical protein
MIIIEHNASTGKITERSMNAKEVAEFEKVQNDAATAEENKVITKAALLARLGINAEEAAILLS